MGSSERGIVLLPLMLLLLRRAYAQNCGCSSGQCCSQYGYCGTGNDYCGSGCKEGACYSSGGSPTNRIKLLLYIAYPQNCGCSSGLCCSEYGSCGTGDEFCGSGCQEGPCYFNADSGGGGGVSSIVSKGFFDGIIADANGECVGKSFYTYEAFLMAAQAYSGFGTTGSSNDAKRELAAFFAHVTDLTDSFCYIETIDDDAKNVNCDETFTDYPCVAGKRYIGRGPIQLSWNYNYGAAGKDIGFDGLREPEMVAEDATVSFKTAVWFWMKGSDCHNAITSGRGFGGTIEAVNGASECNGGNTQTVNNRISYYQNYCRKLGVEPGSNLSC